MPSEAQARITINKLLEEAGWLFLPDAEGRRENIICEHRVTRRTFAPSQDHGKDFEHLRARDASLFGALSRLPADERQALIGYIQASVPLKEFEKAA